MYDLPISKIVATVTDNGANFAKAFKEFGIQNNNESEYDEFNEEEVLQFVDVQIDAENNPLDPDAQYTNATLAYHQRCATHTLNLIASSDINKYIKNNTALKRLHHPALAKCTLLWNASGRPKSAETIYSILGFKLSYAYVTRWNSLYDSLCLVIKAKEKLNSVFESLGSNTQFKSYELEYLSDYIDIVKPISIALDKLQGEQNCYYGQLIPTLFALKTKYKKMLVLSSMPGSMTPTENRSLDRILNIRPQTSLISDILLSLKKRFKNYYELSPEVNQAILASMSHPFFKLRWLDLETPPSTKKTLCDLFVNSAKTIASEYTSETISSISNSESDDDFYEMLKQLNNEKEADSVSNTEAYNLFTSTPLEQIQFHSKIDIEVLQFLEDKSKDLYCLNQFPHVKQLFLKYNVVLPSFAAVERLFSFAGMINTPKRSNLSDKTFEKLVFLKGNQQFLAKY